MPESFEMFQYLEHVCRRWRIPLLACAVALVVALVASLLQPSQYTATARVIIQSPASGDLRASLAVSPIYLESLKTYELVASGDGLFASAIDHFHLPRSKPFDRLKRSVLKTAIPRNTEVLEISATLQDPRQAQALALYIAEQTVKLTRDLALEADRDAVADAQKHWDDARARLSQNSGTSAQSAVEAAGSRLEEARSTAGYRSERLKIIDPGVVPERPSSPNVPLNLIVALSLALVGSLGYLTVEFNYRLEKSSSPRTVAPLARVKGLHD